MSNLLECGLKLNDTDQHAHEGHFKIYFGLDGVFTV